MSTEDRAEAMAARLRRDLHWKLSAEEIAIVGRAYRLALGQRRPPLQEHDAALLHPGRTVLILAQDSDVTSATVLAASALVDTYNSSLAVPVHAIERELGSAIASLVSEVPKPESARDELLEQLISAEYDVRLIALAERLDHARHVHMMRGTDWHEERRTVEEIYLPVAMRTHELLARRLSWWLHAFSRRHPAA